MAMKDGRSTNDIRMIAQTEVGQQNEVCEARRENLADRIEANARQVERNADALASLTINVNTLTTNVASLASTISSMVDTSARRTRRIDTLEESVTRLKARPAIYSAIGAAVGAGAPLLLEVIVQMVNNR